MDDRDHFAAAALTGYTANPAWDDVAASIVAEQAYADADAMLRERDESKPPEPCVWKDGIPVAWCRKTNHDAAPAARANAESVAPQPTAGDRSGNPTSHSGTGKQPAPPSVETDGFSPGSRTGPIIQPPERESPRRECGESSLRDVPQPDNGRAAGGPEPSLSAESDTTEPRNGALGEPVAWAVWGGEYGYLSLLRESADEAVRYDGGTLVPLYCRPQPTLTDAEREAVERGYCSLMGVEDMSAECTRWDAEAAATLRKLLERLG